MFGAASIANASAPGFRQPIEDAVTRYCFGDVWQRPGLDRKMRSLLTIAMLAVLAKPTQLRAHVKGAIANGASVEEIRETLMQVMIYGGVPAATDGFAQAEEVLRDMELI